MRGRKLGALGFTAVILLASSSVEAAKLTLVNLDGNDEGFNDSTAVAPKDGNPGTTVGQQRLNAFQAAADAWGGIVDSSVEIFVNINMDPLTCTATSGTLGSAGPTTFFRDFTGAPQTGTWYAVGLANALSGVDRSTQSDIDATFNSSVGEADCLTSRTWWYGLSGSPSPTEINFFDVVLHEIAHGLGFASLVDTSTGAKALGRDDAYSRLLEDHSLGKLWPNMTDAERMASAIDTGDLHWVGKQVVEKSGAHSAGIHSSGHPEMYAPSELEGGSSVSHFSTTLTPNELMEPMTTSNPGQILTNELMEDLGWVTEILPPGTGDCPHGIFSVSQAGEVCSQRAYSCGRGSGCFNTGKGADLAEHIDATEALELGDLVEIDPQIPRRYRKARGSHTNLVVGVITSVPAITLANGPLEAVEDNRPLLALMGRVPVKATTENGPIRVGDLLVSSSTPGAVMRCTDSAGCAGALIGKALEALAEGNGTIETLLMH